VTLITKSEAEGSHSFQGRTFPRHQQSLEIPSHRGDDEDIKSTPGGVPPECLLADKALK